MTKENKQALEDLQNQVAGRHTHYEYLGKWAQRHYETLEAALQPKPSVDVEALEEVIYNSVLYNCVVLEFDYSENPKIIAEDVKDFLQSQGHLNQGWQTIESAPKDGTLVLLLDIHGNHRIGGYELNYLNRKWGACWEGGDWEFKIDFDPQPVKWQPLPKREGE